MTRVAVDGASPDEVAAVVAALEALSAEAPTLEREMPRSRWRVAGRALDDGFDVLRRRRR